MAQDFYQLLGVAKGINPAELKKAYRKLARKHHPDVNPGNLTAEAKFKEIQHAYDVLSDAKQREVYDQVGHDAFTAGHRNGGPGTGEADFGGGFRQRGGGGPGYTTYTWSGGAPGGGGGREYQTSGEVNELFEQLFNQGFGGSGSWEGAPFGGRARANVRRKGGDKQHSVSIDFEDAYRGKEIMLHDHRLGKTIKVRIPAGIDSGGKVRVAGRGEEGVSGGPPGDLIIQVSVQPHAWFERRGDNIYLEAPVTLAEAALGATIEVPTMDGKVQMKVPAGSQNGAELRLRGKGFPHLRGAGRGDQYVRLNVVVPRELDMRSRELLREIAERNPGNPRTGRWE